MGMNKTEANKKATAVQGLIPAAHHRRLKLYCINNSVLMRDWVSAAISAAIDALPKGGK